MGAGVGLVAVPGVTVKGVPVAPVREEGLGLGGPTGVPLAPWTEALAVATPRADDRLAASGPRGERGPDGEAALPKATFNAG